MIRFAACLLALTLGLTSAAYAQPSAAEQALLEQYTETSEPTLLLRIAEARHAAGDGPGAAEALERFLTVAPDAAEAPGVRTALEQLRAMPAVLEVSSTPEGAEVALDGEARGRTPVALQVPPGSHALTLSLEGHEPAEDTVIVPFASRRAVTLTLTPLPPPEPVEPEPEPAITEAPAPQMHRAAVIATASVAAAGIITGTTLGFLALSAQSDYEEAPTVARADRGEALALGADLAFGVGAAAGITAIILYFVDEAAGDAGEVASGPSLRLAGANAGFGLGGRLDF